MASVFRMPGPATLAPLLLHEGASCLWRSLRVSRRFGHGDYGLDRLSPSAIRETFAACLQCCGHAFSAPPLPGRDGGFAACSDCGHRTMAIELERAVRLA